MIVTQGYLPWGVTTYSSKVLDPVVARLMVSFTVFFCFGRGVFDFVCEPKVEGSREVTFLLCLTSVIGTRFSL